MGVNEEEGNEREKERDLNRRKPNGIEKREFYLRNEGRKRKEE